MELDDHQAKIRQAYKQQKHSKCLELIEATPASVKNSSQFKILKASCLNNIGGKSKEALSILDDVLKHEPLNAFAHYGKGLVYINIGNLIDSISCFEKAILMDPSEKMNKARQMKSRAENMLKPTKNEVKAEVHEGERQNVKVKRIKRKKSDPVEPSKCTICEKSFLKPFSLTRHMLLHTGIRPHPCQICNYGFIQKSDLDRHMATHSDVANHECTMCEKRFKTKKNLHCHLLTHSTARPYKCRFCPKDFKIKRLVKFHESLHAKKPFHCDICTRGFANKAALTNHSKQHNKVKKEETMSEPEMISMPVQIKMETSIDADHSDQPSDFDDIQDHIVNSYLGDEGITFGDSGENSDLNFCLSLLKDVSKMNVSQKDAFKKRALAAIKDVMQ